MEFIYTKKIEISVVFEAPLLGFNVKAAYLSDIEKSMKEELMEHFEEGIHEQKVGFFQVTSKIENDFRSTKFIKPPKK